MRVKEHISKILQDKLLVTSYGLWAIMILLHIYQYFDSGHTFNPLVRIIVCSFFPIFISIGLRNGLYWFFFLYGNLLALNTTFQNYTAFIILVLFTLFKPKLKYLTLALYTCEIVFIATLRDKTPVHFAIHSINCAMIYLGVSHTLKPQVKKLNLTNDERLILDELLKGRQQKEIELFSQNTVTNKIKQARERNGINTTDELLLLYRKEK